MSALDFTARALALRATAQIPAAIEELTTTMLRDGASSADFAEALAAMTASRSGPLVDVNYLSEYEAGYRIEPGYYEGIGALAKASGKFGLVAPSLGSVVIRIPDGEYFLTHTSSAIGLHFENIIFLGGKGTYRATGAGTNVHGNQFFRNCYFIDYTECAIQNNATDHPYLRVESCFFKGKSGESTIGIAWGGLLDGLVIEKCEFLRNAVDLKLGGGTGNISGSFAVRDCDFLSFGGTAKQADIWVVPPHRNGGFGTNSGHTGLFQHNKFGNENQTAGAPRILIAAESPADIAAGKPRGAIFPQYTWDPSAGTGYTDIVTGLIFDANRWAAGSGINAPIIRSYVPDLRELCWTEFNQFDGSPYDWLCEFMGERVGNYASRNWNIALNPSGKSSKTFPFAKGLVGHPVGGSVVECAIGAIRDPAGLAQAIEGVLPCAPVTFDHGYSQLKDLRLPAGWSTAGSVTVASSADIYGATATQDVTFSAASTAANHVLYSALPVMTADRLAWVQLFGLERAAATSALWIRVRIIDSSTQGVIDQRDILLPPNGSARSVTWPIQTPSGGASSWKIHLALPPGLYEAGVKTKFRFAGAYVNYGIRPAPFGHVRLVGGDWNQPHFVSDDGWHMWRRASNGQFRQKASAPAGASDGTPVTGTPEAAIANATDGASAITQLNLVLAALRAKEIIAS